MNFDRLTALLLDRAIRGELVPQLDSEPAVEQIGEAPKDVPFAIPEKWKWVSLKECCSQFLVPMRDKPSFDGGEKDIPWCRIEDIEGKFLNGSKSDRYLTKEEIKSKNLKVNPVGTVISACSASIGAAAITTVECCTNQTFIGLCCKEGVLFNEYLYWVLMASTDRLLALGTGTTIKYISRKKYEQLLVPLPPVDEQHRIVRKLNDLLGEVEKLSA